MVVLLIIIWLPTSEIGVYTSIFGTAGTVGPHITALGSSIVATNQAIIIASIADEHIATEKVFLCLKISAEKKGMRRGKQ